MKPTIPITSKAFKYRDSAHTDIAATFARARRRLAEQQRQSGDNDGKLVRAGGTVFLIGKPAAFKKP